MRMIKFLVPNLGREERKYVGQRINQDSLPLLDVPISCLLLIFLFLQEW